MQALAEGDLSERARQRAAELANDADLRLSPPKAKRGSMHRVERCDGRPAFRAKGDDRLPLPGTILHAQYKGQTLQVKVLPHGFEYEGEVYKSLSAVAKAITGQHCNGYLFFRLERRMVSNEAQQHNNGPPALPAVRCAVYTRKSTEEGLEQEFNTLGRPARSRRKLSSRARPHEGWHCLPDRYDDGGFTGGNMDRPALNACWPTSRRAKSTASSSTKSIV